MNPSLLLLFGLFGVVVGAEAFVRGASALALRLGIPSIIVGLTIVALGTSAPELAVLLKSILAGHQDIGIGSIVGSNISNFLLILGVAAMLAPPRISGRLLKTEMPILLAISILIFPFAWNLWVTRLEGIILVAILIIYFALLFKQNKSKQSAEFLELADLDPRQPMNLVRSLAFLVIGLIALITGSGALVDGASQVAKLLGVSDLVIGLTVVALGTSLPELATTIIAAIKNEPDLAVGNAVGSNILNLVFVLGISTVVSPTGISVAPYARNIDIPVMIAVTLLCAWMFINGKKLTRANGVVLIICYVGYMAYLVLRTLQGA